MQIHIKSLLFEKEFSYTHNDYKQKQVQNMSSPSANITGSPELFYWDMNIIINVNLVNKANSLVSKHTHYLNLLLSYFNFIWTILFAGVYF